MFLRLSVGNRRFSLLLQQSPLLLRIPLSGLISGHPCSPGPGPIRRARHELSYAASRARSALPNRRKRSSNLPLPEMRIRLCWLFYRPRTARWLIMPPGLPAP